MSLNVGYIHDDERFCILINDGHYTTVGIMSKPTGSRLKLWMMYCENYVLCKAEKQKYALYWNNRHLENVIKVDTFYNII